MKKIIILMVAMILFLFVPLGCAQSEDSSDSEDVDELLGILMETIDEFCKEQSRFAMVVMAGRQDGLPMSIIFDEISKQKGLSDKERLKGIVMEAYATPRFSIKGNRKEAMENFANKVYLNCAIAERKKSLKVLRESK